MKTYLKLYNLILAIGWAALLILYIINGCKLDSVGLLLLNICQFAAVLEIIHAAMKIVSSPVVTTIKQLGSRFMVVVLIDLLKSEEYVCIKGITGLHLIMFAWGITEIVRYSFYFSGLIGKEIKMLTFLRYTLFLVLYPMGVAGELLIILAWMAKDGFTFSVNDVIFGIIFLSYFVFFPGMFRHMLSQRKKKL
jgi:very-long-chain (3R)-3-hydroxyacyl-CoA dehydratase